MPPIADIKLTNPSLLLPDDERMLSRFAEFMRAKNCSVQIEGFTSGAKSRKNGDDRRRAETVRNYLTKDLVAKDQVKAEGKGEPPEKGLTPEQKKFARIVP
jgi:outer membrane protein OmpA-like peptidoglycan-associated protein